MKLISTVLRHNRLDQVENALAMANVSNFLAYDAVLHGGGANNIESYKGITYVADSVSRLRVEIIVDDEAAEYVIEVLEAACDDGKPAERLTWAMEVSRAIDLHLPPQEPSGAAQTELSA